MDDLWVVLPHLGAGGAQKVGLLAAEHFSAQGYRVKVLTLSRKVRRCEESNLLSAACTEMWEHDPKIIHGATGAEPLRNHV